MRGFTLSLGALLLVGLLSPRAGALSCPSYLFVNDANKCNADGFCGWFDMRVFINDNGDVVQDDPGPSSATFADPWTDTANATAGGGDLYGIADSDFDADRSFVSAGGNARYEAPCCETAPSGTAEGRGFALMRVTDLVFSGPEAEVETSLRLVFDGNLEEIATNIHDDIGMSTMQARTTANIGGGICQGFNGYFDFSGYQQRTLLDNSDGEDSLIENGYGVMDPVPIEGQTELDLGPFTVPTGTPLTFELWIETDVLASGNGGFGRATADFSLALGPPGGGEVFVLPEGYTANSPTAGIVANMVPEPDARLGGAVAVGALAGLARRSRVSLG
jgi:hypothetical protein